MTEKRRFELVEGSSSKFWEIAVDGETMSVCYGRIGTDGTAKDKTFASAAEAEREASKLVAEKTKKGYAEVSSAGAAKAAEVEAEAKPAKAKAAKTTAADAEEPAKPAKAKKTKAADGEGPAKPAKTAVPKAGSAEVEALLAAIRKKHREIAAQLRAPASAEALELLRAREVPASMLDLYAVHDGSEAELLGAYRLLPIAEIEARCAEMNEILDKNPKWRERAGAWREDWLPFMADGDGQFYCFDRAGSLDGGVPGQILWYDHETGAQREFTSFDVFVDLLTKLAKKGLLDQASQEESDENQAKYEELYATAQNVGLAKMPAKELKKAIHRLDSMHEAAEKLAIALPLARQYPAEGDLWRVVANSAEDLPDWPLTAEAAANAERLRPARDRPVFASTLARALHKLGRDDEALAVVTTAVKTKRHYLAQEIPQDTAPAFRVRCLARATELRPKDYELWFLLGSEATDGAQRKAALEQVIALCSDADLIRFNESRALPFKEKAEALLAKEREG